MRDGTCVSITQSRLANSEAGGACQNCQFPSRIPIPTLVLSENAWLLLTTGLSKPRTHGQAAVGDCPGLPQLRRGGDREDGVREFGVTAPSSG